MRWNGDEVFLTNSHCTDESHAYDGGPLRQPTGNWPIIGYEILDPSPHTCGYPGFEDDCRQADVAMFSPEVPIDLGKIARTVERAGGDGNSGSLEVDHSDPTLTITGKRLDVFENEDLDKIGRTTGWTHGGVEDTCDDVEMAGWVRQCSDRVDYYSDGGDSGSPVFILNSSGISVTLAGLNFGTIGWPYNDSWMSDMRQIEKDMGELIVEDAPVVVEISGPTFVPPNQQCEWDSSITSPGRPPYTYEWRRDGVTVGTGDDYLADSGTSDFRLEVQVTDGEGDTNSDDIWVDVDEDGEGCWA